MTEIKNDAGLVMPSIPMSPERCATMPCKLEPSTHSFAGLIKSSTDAWKNGPDQESLYLRSVARTLTDRITFELGERMKSLKLDETKHTTQEVTVRPPYLQNLTSRKHSNVNQDLAEAITTERHFTDRSIRTSLFGTLLRRNNTELSLQKNKSRVKIDGKILTHLTEDEVTPGKPLKRVQTSPGKLENSFDDYSRLAMALGGN